MNTKQIRNLIRNTFRYGKATEAKRVKILQELEAIKDEDPFFYYAYTGKINTLYGRYDEAIKDLEESIKLNDKAAVSYFNLYKCYAAKGEHSKALMNLFDCRKSNLNDGNFDLPIAMLSCLIDMDIDFIEFKDTDYHVEESNRIFFSDVDGLLNEMYNDVICAFNEKRYHDALKRLGDMKGHILKTNCPLDIESLLIIMREIVKNEKEKNRELILVEQNSFDSDEDYSKYFSDIISKNYVSTKFILMEIEKLIKNDSIKKAVEILDTVRNMNEFADYSLELEYLENLLNEKIALLGLDNETREIYRSLRESGSSQYHHRRYREALKSYEEAYAISNLSICEYYIGKCLFKMRKIDMAEEYFLRYLEHGGEKVEKCLLFLVGINKIRGKEYNIYSDKMTRLNTSFGREFKFVPREDGKYNNGKQNGTKKTKFTVGDFKTDTTVNADIENYYNYGIDGKLMIIRELYRNGKTYIANSLLDELNKTCSSEEKPKVMQMMRNRKLYETQAKFS